MSFRRLGLITAVALFLIVAPNHLSPLQGAPGDYGFTKIADNNGKFQSFGIPSLNDNGTLAFTAEKDNGIEGMYTASSSGSIQTVADSTGDFDDFENFSSDINIHDTVAYVGTLDSGEKRISIGSAGGSATTVAQTSGGSSGYQYLADAPAINDAGTVAFGAHRYSDPDGSPTSTRLVTWQSSGSPTPVLDHTGDFERFFLSPKLNNNGTMAFYGIKDDAVGGEAGVFKRQPDGSVTSVADSDDSVRGSPTYNITDDGTVAFVGNTGPSGNTTQGLYTSQGGSITKIADETGNFDSFQDMVINDSGDLVFSAMLDSGGTGVFAGPDPVTDRVLAPGDTMFGGEITGAFFINGLNGNGDIAFVYGLDTEGDDSADEAGVAIARIPTPGTLPLLFGGAIAVLYRRSRPDVSQAGC